MKLALMMGIQIVMFTAMLSAMIQSVSAQVLCGDAIGVNSGQLVFHDDSQHFYLNVGDPAGCTGNVSSFTYCYYRPSSINNNANYIFNFAVYRETISGIYEKVSPVSVVAVMESDLSAFDCLQFIPNEQVTIEMGDVLGACIFNPPGSSQELLSIVGRHFSFVSKLMRKDASGCEDNGTPVIISSSSLSNVYSRVLHLYANIEVIPTFETTATTTTSVTTATMSATTATTNSATTTVANSATTTATTTATKSAITTTTDTDITTTTNIAKTTSVWRAFSTMETVETEHNEQTSWSESVSGSVTTTNEITEPSFISMYNESTDIESRLPGADIIIIAPIVVAIFLVVMVTAISTALVILLCTRRKRKSKVHISRDSASDATYDSVAIVNSLRPENMSSSHFEGSNRMVQNDVSNSSQLDHSYEFETSDWFDQGCASGYIYSNTQAESLNSKNNNLHPVFSRPLDSSTISFPAEQKKTNEKDIIYQRECPYQLPASREDEIYAQFRAWGVRRIKVEDIEIIDHLGSGQFGSVERGQWKRPGTRPVDVALKSPKKNESKDRLKFLQEAATMAQFRHPNVILLHGVVTQGDLIMLVVELVENEDLVSYLSFMKLNTSKAGCTPNLMLHFSQQVSLGMQYLSAKGFVHRDLAARNVLISLDNTCKVSDFGMSRDLADENYYVSEGQDKIPVKWTAPEAIHYKKYSTASDVWAYGCLLYEIWSVGRMPFQGLLNIKAIRLVDSGERLPPPPGCPKMIYELMILCWHPQTTLRPNFSDIVLTLVGSEKIVLNIPMKDSSTDPLAGVLGAPLKAGENMYTDLQNKYIDNEQYKDLRLLEIIMHNEDRVLTNGHT